MARGLSGDTGLIKFIRDRILTGGRRTSASAHREVEEEIASSSLNIVDGGNVVQALAGYVSELTPTDNKHFAPKKYVDDTVAAAAVGIYNDRGSYDPTATSAYPATGGSGVSGAIKKGDIWTISVAGTISGTSVKIGDTVRALVDTPGQTAGNWDILFEGVGYSPVNKVGDTMTGNLTLPSTGGVIQSAEGSSVGFLAAGVDVLINAVRDVIFSVGRNISAVVVGDVGITASTLTVDAVTEFNDNTTFQANAFFNGDVNLSLTPSQALELDADGNIISVPKIDGNGTPASEILKLQAGGAGDWNADNSYAGATSGAITGTKGGQRFYGQDATTSEYYRYEAETDNVWHRSPKV